MIQREIGGFPVWLADWHIENAQAARSILSGCKVAAFVPRAFSSSFLLVEGIFNYWTVGIAILWCEAMESICSCWSSQFFNSVQSSFLRLFSLLFFSFSCLLWSIPISHLTFNSFPIARLSFTPSYRLFSLISPRSIHIFVFVNTHLPPPPNKNGRPISLSRTKTATHYRYLWLSRVYSRILQSTSSVNHRPECSYCHHSHQRRFGSRNHGHFSRCTPRLPLHASRLWIPLASLASELRFGAYNCGSCLRGHNFCDELRGTCGADCSRRMFPATFFGLSES